MSVLVRVRRASTLACAVLGALVLVAACGSTVTGSGGTAGATASSPSSAGPSQGAAGSAAPTDSLPPTTSIQSSGDNTATLSPFCAKAKIIEDASTEVSTPAGLKSFIAKVQAAADVSPTEIKSDVQALVATLKMLAAGNYDTASLKKLTTHEMAIARYVNAHC